MTSKDATDVAEKADIAQSEVNLPASEHGSEKDFTTETPVVISQFASLTRGQCIRKFWRLYGTGVAVSLAGMYSGYANSIIGSIVANQGFIDFYATKKDPVTGVAALDPQHISLWEAIYFGASIMIQTVAPIAADKFGRKFNMWLVTGFLTSCIIIQVFAPYWWVLLIARFVAGLAAGMNGASVMIYMSEIAMPQFRGALLSSFALAVALGQAFQAIALKVLQVTGPLSFRNAFYSEFVFTGIWLIPMLYLPDTPAWYASKGRDKEGKKAPHRLVGKLDGFDIDHEFSSNAMADKESAGASWGLLFKNKTNLKRVLISTLPFTFQNFVGVPLMFGYTTDFFQLAGVSDPFLGNIIKQMVLVVGIALSFYMVNAFVYAISLAPIGWVSIIELSAPILRAKTTSFAVTIQYLSGLLFTYTVPLMLSNQYAGWGQKVGLFLGGTTLLFLIPCVLFYPETKGHTYPELDELFQRGIPAWRFASTRTAHLDEVATRAVGEDQK